MSSAPDDRTGALWNVDDVARYLAVKPSTIRKWVFKRRIPYSKLNGKLVRFDPAEIRSWVRAGRPSGYPTGRGSQLLDDLNRRLREGGEGAAGVDEK